MNDKDESGNPDSNEFEPLVDKQALLKKQATGIFDYDPNQIPADLELAKDHHKAMRIALPDYSVKKINIDEVTGLPVDNIPLPLCCDVNDLSFLSTGYPMFFQYCKFVITTMALFYIFSGLFQTVTNFKGGQCIPFNDLQEMNLSHDELKKKCLLDDVTIFSLGNKVNQNELIIEGDVYNLFTVVLILFFSHFCRIIQRVTAVTLDELEITASDFTCWMGNLPKFDEEEDIKAAIAKFIAEKTERSNNIEVKPVQVVLCYDYTDVKDLKKQVQEKSIERYKLTKETSQMNEEAIQKLTSEIEDLKTTIRKRVSEFIIGDNSKFKGEAYVSFETQRGLQCVLEYWELSFWERREEAKKGSESKFMWRGKIPMIRQAREPSDVFWENAGEVKTQKIKKRLLTIGKSLIVILACFVLMFAYKYIKKSIVRQIVKDRSYNFFTNLELQVLSAIAAFGVIWINDHLKVYMTRLCNGELHSTLTSYQKSLTVKLAIAQIINTGLVVLIFSWISNNTFSQGGLQNSIYRILQFNAIFPLLMNWWDGPYRKKQKARAKIESEKGKDIEMTQEQLNELYEDPTFAFSARLAYFSRTMCVIAFFAPLVPILSIWGILGMVGMYWIDKTQMLKKRSRGVSLSHELPILCMVFVEMSGIFFAIGNVYFNAIASDDLDWDDMYCSLIGFVLATIHLFLPSTAINEFFVPPPSEKETDDTFTSSKSKFLENYDRSSPAIKDYHIAHFAKVLQNEISEDDILEEYNFDGKLSEWKAAKKL